MRSLVRDISKPARTGGLALLVLAVVLAMWLDGDTLSGTQQAYIGPGAGIAVLGSFLTVLAAGVSAIVVIVRWPIVWAWRAIRGRRAYANARAKRVVIVGLDGLEPTLTEQFLEEGLLPNLAKLRDRGTCTKLATTCPPISPVAWASFSTGTNPGKHNIFDFLGRNALDYQPRMSSVRIEQGRRHIKLGRFVIPLSKPTITSLRKSKPFWKVLGDAGVFSAVLRVPLTFPPDKFHGVQLSAMCVPDLRGTQGTFTHFSENGQATGTHGEPVAVMRNGNVVCASLAGPDNTFLAGRPEVRLPLKVTGAKDGNAVLHVDGQKVALTIGSYSPWVRVAFPMAPGVKVRGICRFLLKRFDEPFEMYCTPVQIDPARPVMPISHPRVYSTYLAALLGPFATLGLAEDTGALSDGVLTEDEFLTQTYDIHDERERMLLDSLRRVKRGMVACVFDAPDRVQHVFWRNDPAAGNQDNGQANAIRDMYVKMDQTVGRIMAQLDDDTTLFVMSDHGFKSFRRGVDLNAWLLANGYLYLKDDEPASGREYLADVDWSRTKAYALGLAGIYINLKGREGQGIVAAGSEADALVGELTQKLNGLVDPVTQETAIHEAIRREDTYSGPYVDAAPDVIVGYSVGYRVSWGSAVGKCGTDVFSDNTKAWSGDHCIHPSLVPGVLFSSLGLNNNNASIVDLAPTVLELFGLPVPPYVDGRSLLCVEEPS